MKRLIKLLILTAVLAALLAATALAADFTHCADALKDLGLFQGTGQGYDLDRTPTRAEAGAMLVRLLGKDAEANALKEYTAPFTDVAGWARPYVQYLYDNSLTTGKTATTFGSADRCTAQQYATFLLRALGYSDAAGGDFTYATAMEFARQKGVVDLLNCNEDNFLRDDVAAMSYTALSLPPKSGEADLLTKLVNENAVASAKGYDKRFADFRAYAAASSDDNAVSAKMEITLGVKLANVDYLSGKIAMDVAADVDTDVPAKTRMAIDMNLDLTFTELAAQAMGLSAADARMQSKMQCYYVNDVLYLNTDGVKQKAASPAPMATLMKELTGTTSGAPICAVAALERTASGGTDRYTMTFAPRALNRAMTVIAAQPAGYAIGYDALTMEAVLRSGQLQSAAMDMALHAAMEGMVMDMQMQLDMRDIRTGSAVRVNLPADLASYPDAAGSANGPTSTFIASAA